jgi:hypothetical protein
VLYSQNDPFFPDIHIAMEHLDYRCHNQLLMAGTGERAHIKRPFDDPRGSA